MTEGSWIRTFPIYRLSSTPPDGTAMHAMKALDFLYNGKKSLTATDVSRREVSQRAANSIIRRLTDLRDEVGVHVFDSLTLSSPAIQPPASCPGEDADWSMVMQLKEITSPNADSRGKFTLLDTNRIDLPEVPVTSEPVWVEMMPEEIQQKFSDPHLKFFYDPMMEALDASIESPRSRVHSLKGHYPRILEKAYRVGVVDWSDPKTESIEYSKLAKRLTMTSFAVRKDEKKDRMISWPRFQNMILPDPPYTELPTPDLFSTIRIEKEAKLEGFYFDISNMFHNIRLPKALAKLMPLTPVTASSLSERTIAGIEASFGRSIQPYEKIRPIQATLPMGFKWAVYIAHTLAARCMKRAFDIVRSAPVASQLPSDSRLVQLHRNDRLQHVRAGDVLLLHIIDDVNPVCINWNPEVTILFNHVCSEVFEAHGLPRKTGKSSPLNAVVTDKMPFMGWSFDFTRQILRPLPKKMHAAIADAGRVLASKTVSPEALKSTIGRLIWIALGARPILSSLLHVFHVAEKLSLLKPSLAAVAKRELFTITRILPLSHIRLQRPTWEIIIAFDASNTAGGVCFATLPVQMITGFEKFMYDKPDARSAKEVLKLAALVKSLSWETAFCHKWRRSQHINSLECNAAVLAIEWAVSHPITGHRAILLSDSLVTIGALQKGRSSSVELALPCRRFAAVVMAHDLQPILIHIPSELNPADGPSRLRNTWE